MRGVPRIQPHGGHEALDDPPDAVPREGAALAGEERGLGQHGLSLLRLPGQERLQVPLQVLRDEDLLGFWF